MSLLGKYLEGKKEMHVKLDKARADFEKQMDVIGGEFLDKFKVMIAEASDDEFHEFMCKSGDKLDNIERMAALTARLDSYGERCKENEEKEPEDEPKKKDGPHIVIVELG